MGFRKLFLGHSFDHPIFKTYMRVGGGRGLYEMKKFSLGNIVFFLKIVLDDQLIIKKFSAKVGGVKTLLNPSPTCMVPD